MYGPRENGVEVLMLRKYVVQNADQYRAPPPTHALSHHRLVYDLFITKSRWKQFGIVSYLFPSCNRDVVMLKALWASGIEKC